MKGPVFLLKAISDANRLRILGMLAERPMCVCELAFVLGITQPSVSRHLKKLKKAGLIVSRQESFWTNYHLSPSDPVAREAMKFVKSVIERDGTVKKDILKASRADRAKLCCR